jgi:metaxin
MASVLAIPPPLKAFFALFPLYTYPAIQTRERKSCSKSPTLWIHPPFDPSSNFLSSDIECLKWQAYIALRGPFNISVRWDLPPDAGIDRHLPNLCTYSESAGDYELLEPKMIPGWIDAQVPVDTLDGFSDEEAKLESEAWISLLEGTVHAAVVRTACCVSKCTLTLHRFWHNHRSLCSACSPPLLPSTHPPIPSTLFSLNPSLLSVG